MTSKTADPEAANPELARYAGLTIVRVKISMDTPMLHHRIPPETLMKIHNKEKEPKSAPNPPPREVAHLHMYRDEAKDPEGKIAVVPMDNIFASLREAGCHVRLDGKKQISTGKTTRLPGLMGIIDGPFFPLKEVVSGKPSKWETDIRPARNDKGALVCAIRPRFDDWSITLTIWVDQREVGLDKIRELFDIAGSRIGLCSFRPERKGWFGKFRVDEWRVVKGPGKP